MINIEDSKLSEKADLIFVVTEYLSLQYQKYQNKVHVVPNGVDVKWIEKYKEKAYLMDDIKTINKPIIGFVGGIDDGIDIELILYIAKKRPTWSIVMIGNLHHYNRSADQLCTSLPNLHFLGSKQFEDVPAYVDKFDVCILPFKDNKRNRSRSAMKLYVYMALGKPIVSRPVADAEKFSSTVLLAKEKAEFLRAIEKALTYDSIKARQARVSMAETQSWDKRAEDIYGLMVDALVKKNI